MIIKRNPDNVHTPVAAYAHQIEVSGKVRWLVLSGQIGREVDESVPEDPVKQLELAFDNIEKNLQAAKMEMKDLVKIVIYLVGEMDPVQRRAVISKKLNGHEPCMTLLYVAGLAHPAYKVEIDAWACVEEQ
jgi:2-iminobutanoate/2-iminopropanoate deaminase